MMNSRSFKLIALVLPILGFIGHIGISHYKRQQGEPLTLSITGYDPRDLLRGRYLQFQYALDEPQAFSDDHGGECYVPRSLTETETRLVRTPCEVAQSLRAWVDGNQIEGPQKYFIPEAIASELERAFMEHGGALEVRVLPNGKIVVLELLIQGKPWREHLSTL